MKQIHVKLGGNHRNRNSSKDRKKGEGFLVERVQFQNYLQFNIKSVIYCKIIL